jgi:small-conductance mechanosensitive channel
MIKLRLGLSRSSRLCPLPWLIAGVTLAFVLVPLATFVQAQNQESQIEAITDPAGADVTAPIPPSEISVEAETTESTLREMRSRSEPDEAIQHIASVVPKNIDRLQAFLDQTRNQLATPISARDLEDLKRRWDREAERLKGTRSRVNERARSLDANIASLNSMRERWGSTLQAARASDAQPAQIEIIRDATVSIEGLEIAFGERRAEVLTLQRQLQQATDITEAAFELLSSASRIEPSRFFSLEAPPLWEVVGDTGLTVGYAEQVRTAWDKTVRELREFGASRRTLLIIHALIFLGLVALLIYWSRRARKLDPDIPHLETTRRILRRPLSSALILAIALALILYPRAPRPVESLALIVLFLPLFRILPGDLLSRQRGLLLALFGLFVLNRAVDLLAYLSLEQRLILLLQSGLVLWVIGYAKGRLYPEGAGDRSRPVKITRAVGRLAQLLVVGAVVANVAGDVRLAATVTRAVVFAGYIALLLYAFYLVLRSLLWIAVRSPRIRVLRMVQRHEALLCRRLLWGARLVLVLLWITESLKALQVYPALRTGLHTVLTAEARFGEVGVSLGDVLGFAVTVWAAFLISRFLRFVLEEDVYGRLHLPRGVPHAFSTGLHYTILLAAFFLAIAATGFGLNRFTILAGAFGVGIGFGLQNVVNNFISGLILLVERPILPGDTVQLGELTGVVKRIGMRSSTVRTWEGAEVIVPNGNLISNEVINWTLSDRLRRIHIDVGVAYGTDPAAVMELLVTTAKTHKDVLPHPAPHALFLGFGESSLDFQLRIWTGFEDFLRVKSEVTLAVERELRAANMEIPFPQRDLHVRSVDPEARKDLRD